MVEIKQPQRIELWTLLDTKESHFVLDNVPFVKGRSKEGQLIESIFPPYEEELFRMKVEEIFTDKGVYEFVDDWGNARFIPMEHEGDFGFSGIRPVHVIVYQYSETQ